MTNASKAVELALAQTIQEYAEVGAGVSIRPWQSLAEAAEGAGYARRFPCIDIRCSPPSFDDNAETRRVVAMIECRTKTDDDESHAIVVGMYEAALEVCDKLFYQARNTTGDELTAFAAAVADVAPNVALGGFSFDAGMTPYDDDGDNALGIALAVHYSRSDM